MFVLVVLLLATATSRLIGVFGIGYVDSWPEAIAVGLAAMFVMTGVAHFVNPLRRDMIAIVPPRLPEPALLVSVTGVAELLGAAGLLFPPTRMAAAGCLFALMIVMFPANIHAARMPHPPKSMTTRLGPRTAEQILFLGAAVVAGLGGVQ
jgi:uncharacterized membrane protein